MNCDILKLALNNGYSADSTHGLNASERVSISNQENDEFDWENDLLGDRCDLIMPSCEEINCDLNEILESIDFNVFATDAEPPFDTTADNSTASEMQDDNLAVDENNFTEPNNGSLEYLLPNARRSGVVITSLVKPSGGLFKKGVSNGMGPSRRVSKKKMKGLPKRPLSKYNLFFHSERLKILDEAVQNRTRISFENLAKIIGRRWHDVSEEESEKLRILSQRDIERYRDEMKVYHKQKSLSTTDVNDARMESSLSNSKKKVCRSHTSPKRKRKSSESSSDDSILLSPKKEESASRPLSSLKGLHKLDHDGENHDLDGDFGDNGTGTGCSESKLPQRITTIFGDDIERKNSGSPNSFSPSLRIEKSPNPSTSPSVPPCELSPSMTKRLQRLPNCQESPPSHPLPPMPWHSVQYPPYLPSGPYIYHNNYPPPIYPPNYHHFHHFRRIPYILPMQDKEIMLYDPDLKQDRHFKIDYKCYSMKRSEAYAFMSQCTNESIPKNNSRCYNHYPLPAQRLFDLPSIPGVEVEMPPPLIPPRPNSHGSYTPWQHHRPPLQQR
jgi:HMG (high mobility group) box